jgi:hypothetical protein
MKITAFSQPTTELIRYVLEDILSGSEVETFEILSIKTHPKAYGVKVIMRYKINGKKQEPLKRFTQLLTEEDGEEDETTVLKCLDLFGSEIADFCR